MQWMQTLPVWNRGINDTLCGRGHHGTCTTVCPAAQVIEGGAGEEEVADLGRLLGFLDAEMAANRNFEFTQALLRLTLQVCWATRAMHVPRIFKR